MRLRRGQFSLALALVLWAAQAFGHGGESHDAGVTIETTAATASDFPLDFGGEFELINHFGQRVTRADYAGKHMLVFFGYASCKNMCSLTLQRIGRTLELLGDDADRLNPLVITVDPEHDTPETMRENLAKYHPSLIGHTGDTQQLNSIYAAYRQHPKSAGVDWDNDPIISHSSYIFLLDSGGEFATLFPPILNPASMADIIRKYLDGTS